MKNTEPATLFSRIFYPNDFKAKIGINYFIPLWFKALVYLLALTRCSL